MMFLAYAAAFAVYLIISLVVVLVVATRAKTWKWRFGLGILAALFMYNLVFWDYLPTKYAYEYYCKKEAGFWVYKTAEQWRKENPGVVVGPVRAPEGMVLDKKGHGEMVMKDGEKVVYKAGRMWPSGRGYDEPRLTFNKLEGGSGYWLNDRFLWKIKIKQLIKYLPVTLEIIQILDVDKNETLARLAYVGTGKQNYMRVWLNLESCGPDWGDLNSTEKEFKNLTRKK